MKKKRYWFVLALVIVLGMFVLIRSRGKELGSTISEIENQEAVYGVNSFVPSYCMTDGGIVYGYRNHISYYELDENEDYILCSRANCTHLTDSCGAYYADEFYMEGLALYEGYIYRIEKKSVKNCFQLIRTTASGNERKVIATLKIKDYMPGNWVLSTISNVNYMDGQAWMELQYHYVQEDGSEISSGQIVSVDLETGAITEITPLEKQENQYHIISMNRDRIFLRKDWEDVQAESEESQMESWIVYDVPDKTLRTLEENLKTTVYNEEGRRLGKFPKYYSVGLYDGKQLYFETDIETFVLHEREADIALKAWDLEHNTKEDLCVLHHSMLMRLNESNINDAVLDETKLLFYTFFENGTIKTANVLDLQTMETEELFQVAGEWDYRVIGETSDKKHFLLKSYCDTDVELYIITKSDYYGGNPKRMELLKVFEGVYD